MKILFLLPPSEGKNIGGIYSEENLNCSFQKPCDIATNVTQKDLKCKGERFYEGKELNTTLCKGEQREFLAAISRYSGVMYNAINYTGMSDKGRKFFEENFLIFSGMYGILSPKDDVGNYKLPIETKGLYEFWGTQFLEYINDLEADYVINLLPISYAKLIFGKNKTGQKIFDEKRKFRIININFFHPDGKKISHGVKKIKGEWIHDICEKFPNNVELDIQLVFGIFGGNFVEEEANAFDIDIVVE